jgi:predicted MFS family arabinose efflux permease
MAGAALSTGPATFAAAILVAGTAAGPAFAPFSDAAQALQPERRPRVLAAISCGTGYGVALAAPIAIVAGASWRSAWLAFAAVALAASARAWRVLPGRASERQATSAAAATWAGLLDPRARRLLATGVLVGLGSSAYWTFGVAQVTGAGGLPPAAGRTFLGVVGVASVLATGTGELLHRLGVRRAYAAFTTLEAAGLALLALAPGRLAAVLASAVLFGAAYNAAVAAQSIAATELFPERPSLGLSAALAANGLGLLAGPLGAGLIAGPLGLGAVLAAGALLVAAAGALGPTPRRPRAARASRRPGAPPSARRAPRPAPRPGCAP